MIPIKRFSESNEEYIIRASKKLYTQGFTIKEISTMLNVDIINVYNAVIQNKLYHITEENERKEYIDMHNNGFTYDDISSIFKKSKKCIMERIKLGAKYTKKIGDQISDSDLKDIKKLYNNGYTLTFIGRKYNISSKGIKLRLQRCDIWKPNHCTKVPLSSTDKRKVISLLNKGYNLYDISVIIGRPYSIIAKDMKK